MGIASASDVEVALDRAPKDLLIGGEWRDSARERFAVEDPSTGEALCTVANGGAAEAQAAIDAAAGAQQEWRGISPLERSEILRRAFEALSARKEELALLITLEMGKTLDESRAEVAYAAEFFRWFSGEALRIDGYYKASGTGDSRVLVMRQPVGPCYFITPWNFPLAMGTRKIGPAIAAGCTMVVKPAQQTPLSMLALAGLLEDCGLPSGVLNVVAGTSSAEISGPIISDTRLRKLSFTGSTEVGRRLIAQAADTVIRVSMELGGNAPFLVFDDADLDAAVNGALIAKMRNIGESCVAANRFYVSESVAQEFTEKLAERMGSLKLGRGVDDDVDVGPLIDAGQRERVAGLVDDAISRGAICVTGGGRPAGLGYFYEPTVLSEVPDEAQLLTEEIFGPVAPIRTFGSEAEAVAAANDTEYGLVAYVFTRDVNRAMRVSESLETGMVGVNRGLVSNAAAPFGGMKQSGIGREGGNEGVHEYLEPKYVALNTE